MAKKVKTVTRTVKTKNQYGQVEYKLKIKADKAKLLDKAKKLEREQKAKNKANEKRLKEADKQIKIIESLRAKKGQVSATEWKVNTKKIVKAQEELNKKLGVVNAKKAQARIIKERLLMEKQTKTLADKNKKLTGTVLGSAKSKRKILKGATGRQVSDVEYIRLSEEEKGYDTEKKVNYDRLIVAWLDIDEMSTDGKELTAADEHEFKITIPKGMTFSERYPKSNIKELVDVFKAVYR